jgi:hypothetical protein
MEFTEVLKGLILQLLNYSYAVYPFDYSNKKGVTTGSQNTQTE